MVPSRTIAVPDVSQVLKQKQRHRRVVVFVLQLSARLDSNQGPRRYKLRALPTELQADLRSKAQKFIFVFCPKILHERFLLQAVTRDESQKFIFVVLSRIRSVSFRYRRKCHYFSAYGTFQQTRLR